MDIFIVVIVILAVAYFGLVLFFTERKSSPRLDYDRLKADSWHFGKDFLWGSATAAHQVEGNCTNNNWYRFESAVDENGKPVFLNC